MKTLLGYSFNTDTLYVQYEPNRSTRILVPVESLIEMFGAHIEPVVRLVNSPEKTNISLLLTRDLHLSQLIFVELDVSVLDINIREAA